MLQSLCRCFPTRDKREINGSVWDDYESLNIIGTGKTGSVLRAQHRDSLELVAVKLIKRTYLTTASRQEALASEIDILFHADHPGILTLHKVYRNETEVALVTELLTGGEVIPRLSSMPGLNEAEIVRVVRAIMAVLIYLHERGITHRDLKPENIVYATTSVSSRIKVLDFGVSTSGPKNASHMSGMQGTVHYMAPEIFGRGATYNSQIDIWSVGVMTYHLLFGQVPFDGDKMYQIEDAIVAGQYDIPKDAQVSVMALDFMQQCMSDKITRQSAVEGLNHPWLRHHRASVESTVAHRSKLREFVDRTR